MMITSAKILNYFEITDAKGIASKNKISARDQLKINKIGADYFSK